MPIETLVPAVIAAVTPYLAKGAEKLVDKSVDAGFEQRGKIWQLVKGLFVEDDLTLLNLFAENPNDAGTQGELKGELKHLLKAKPDVAAQLEELLKQIPAAPQIKHNTLNQSGSNNIALQDITGGDIKINQK